MCIYPFYEIRSLLCLMRGYRDDYLSYLAVYRVESWKVYYNNSSLVRFRMLSSNHILSESYKHVTKQEQEWCK